MIAPATFERRTHRVHDAPPAPLNPLAYCPHREPTREYGACCLPVGTFIHRNQDIESSSWWAHAPGGTA